MNGDAHDARDTHGLIKKVTASSSYVILVSQVPWLRKVFQDNPIMRRCKPSPFMRIVGNAVQNRLAKADPEHRPHPDLLSYFVATHSKTPALMDQKRMLTLTWPV
jgi:hypothetical protein